MLRCFGTSANISKFHSAGKSRKIIIGIPDPEDGDVTILRNPDKYLPADMA